MVAATSNATLSVVLFVACAAAIVVTGFALARRSALCRWIMVAPGYAMRGFAEDPGGCRRARPGRSDQHDGVLIADENVVDPHSEGSRDSSGDLAKCRRTSSLPR
jgi:hypothetical protein